MNVEQTAKRDRLTRSVRLVSPGAEQLSRQFTRKGDANLVTQLTQARLISNKFLPAPSELVRLTQQRRKCRDLCWADDETLLLPLNLRVFVRYGLDKDNGVCRCQPIRQSLPGLSGGERQSVPKK